MKRWSGASKKWLRANKKAVGNLVLSHSLLLEHPLLSKEFDKNSTETKRFTILRCAILGETGGFPHYEDGVRWGRGRVPLNREGGFGIDSAVRKMIRDGDARLVRYQHHNNPFGGNPTINVTDLVITERGRETFVRLCKMRKRTDLLKLLEEKTA